jgi:hypothetical protein
LSFLALASFAFGQQTIQVTDNDVTGTTTWTTGNTYILNGFVYVEDTLIIEPGVIVKGKPGQGANASALIVARGGYIDAQGTASMPIIMTGESDDPTTPGSTSAHETGLWGGFIVLGQACLNSAPGESAIEGIPTSEVRGQYGAVGDSVDTDMDGILDSWTQTEPCNDEDNSGIIKYVSIRHGGTNIGGGNEINGLTLGGVGSGTEIDYVEVAYNFDDGIEWFGGTVNVKHAVVAHVGDDAFDYDEGWRGKVQFGFILQSDSAGSDRGGEHDGGTSPETAQPFATPTFYNITSWGRGSGSSARAITLRDNAGGFYHNSIFAQYGRGVDIEILGNGDDSYKQFQDGNLAFKNNIFWDVAGNSAGDIFKITAAKYGCTTAMDPMQCLADSTAEVDAAIMAWEAAFAANDNSIEDPGFQAVPAQWNDYNVQLDPTPAAGGPASQNLDAYPAMDDFFTPVNYKGAFPTATPGNDGPAWVQDWTYMWGTAVFGNVSIDRDILNSALTVYPNPNNGTFYLKMEGVQGAPVQFEVLNLMGQVVAASESKVVGGQVMKSFNLSSQPAGVYVLKAQQNGQVIGLERVTVK